jgi:hypothetical protein
MRATHLLVPGHVEPDMGEKCCICGCGTDGAHKGTDFFGDTFRDYREMQYRLSPYICSMCALSLKDVPGGVVRYIDGSQKTPKSEKRGLGWRFFSWYLAEGCEPIGATYWPEWGQRFGTGSTTCEQRSDDDRRGISGNFRVVR